MRLGHRTPSQTPTYVILTVLAVFSLYPIVMLAFNSLKTTREMSANPLGPPTLGSIRWENYPQAWELGRYAVTMRNSAVIAVGSVSGVLLVAGMAAFSLARLKPAGGDALLVYFLVSTALPAMLFMFPLFFLWKQLGLINNLLGVIIVHVARFATFSTFLLRSYMVSIPQDFDDAARIDGASRFQVFRHIIVPVTKPGFLTVGLIVALWSWNEFLFEPLRLREPLLARLGSHERRVGAHAGAGSGDLPHLSTQLHRGDDQGRPEGLSPRRAAKTAAGGAIHGTEEIE
jgi:raffinose/stachyose/melibiose transport system permease protein